MRGATPSRWEQTICGDFLQMGSINMYKCLLPIGIIDDYYEWYNQFIIIDDYYDYYYNQLVNP